MSADAESVTGVEAGQEAGRFCPRCRHPMLYTGRQRDTEVGVKSEEECSNCGLTAWKRHIFGGARQDA